MTQSQSNGGFESDAIQRCVLRGAPQLGRYTSEEIPVGPTYDVDLFGQGRIIWAVEVA